MARNVTKWVWTHSRATGATLIVLLAISDEANGETKMKVSDLARKCRLGERTTQAAITELTVLGELAVTRGGGRGRSNSYRVLAVNPADPAPFNESNPADPAPFNETPQILHPADPAPFNRHTHRSERNPADPAPQVFADVISSTGRSEVHVQTTSAKTQAVQLRPDVGRLCAHLADRIEANGSRRPTVGKRWHDAARLMLDNDGRSEEQIHHAIDWSQDSEFWRINILSMPKLREKYEQLRLQAARTNGRHTTKDRVRQAAEAGRRVQAMLNGES